MILVTLGTQDKSFYRLLEAIDKQIEKKNITEKVIVQAGYTKYESKNMEIFDFIPEDELEKLVKKCNLLITHGGVGSILSGIKNNKKIIAAPRLKKYREHTNDHQKQIVKEFEERGYILALRDFNKLDKVLDKAKNFKITKFKSHTEEFTENIEKYIEEDNHTSYFNKYRELTSNGYLGIILNLINILIFSILLGKYNLYLNIFLSFIITIVISLITNLLIDINYKGKIKNYFIIKIIELVIDLDLMYIFNNIININLVYAKFITNMVIMITSVITIKFCFKKK